MGDRTNGCNSLCGPSSTEKVSCHAFGGGYVHFVRMLAKDRFDGIRFRNIAESCLGAVHIDVMDIRNVQFCVPKSGLHCISSAEAIRIGSRNMVGVSADANT